MHPSLLAFIAGFSDQFGSSPLAQHWPERGVLEKLSEVDARTVGILTAKVNQGLMPMSKALDLINTARQDERPGAKPAPVTPLDKPTRLEFTGVPPPVVEP